MTLPRLSAAEVIRLLNLAPLPGEGGFFVRTYESAESLPAELLAPRYAGPRPLGTAILYLLTAPARSALHRLPTEEILHFYLGDPVLMLTLHPDGTSRRLTLGPDLLAGERVQVVAPRGTWFGLELLAGGEWALLGATLAPGFDWPDLVLGDPEELARAYPAEAELIRRLAPEEPRKG